MINIHHWIFELEMLLKAHKKLVDEKVVKWNEEKEDHAKKYAIAKAELLPEVLERKEREYHDDIVNKFGVEMHKLQSETRARASFYLGMAEKFITQYFTAPIPADFANKLITFQMCGYNPSDTEFELMKHEATSYSAIRALNALAEQRTAKTEKYTADGVETIDAPNPYLMKVPDIDYIQREFKEYSKKVLRVVDQYAGENGELVECLDSAVDRVVAVSADNYFVSSASRHFQEVVSDAISVLPDEKPKPLTPDEQNYIDTIISAGYPELARYKAVNHAQIAPPEVRELLLRDSRYRDAILEAEKKEAKAEADAVLAE